MLTAPETTPPHRNTLESINVDGPAYGRVAHNTLLNLMGLAVPLALAFFVMPIAARELGPARFGLLGLAWATTEYLLLFDLGLGRAIVRFVADALHGGNHDVGELASVALCSQLIFGVVGMGALYFAAPVIVHRVLNVPETLTGEAVATFRVLGASLPVILVLLTLKGVLEGAQRFDLSNLIKMMGGMASVGIPAIAASYGASLPTIMWLILLSRVLLAFLYVVGIRRALPTLRFSVPHSWTKLRELLSFGGWIAVSGVVSPFLVYFDRFALGAIAGMAMVGYYTVPYEAVTRLLVIPIGLISSLLPALTGMDATNDTHAAGRILSASRRTLIFTMALPLTLVLAFAPHILRVWLGPTYAAEAGTALRILSIGVFLNALAHLPMITLYAVKRTDLPAKFHLGELVVHIPLSILLIRQFGIVGAALAWALRVMIDLALLTIGVRVQAKIPATVESRQPLFRAAVYVLLLTIGLFAGAAIIPTMPVLAAAVTFIVLLTFAVGYWLRVLLPAERQGLTRMLTSYRASFSRALRVVS